MRTLRNKVQLIGNVGTTPEIKNLENSTKVATFSLATHEFYKNSKGEKIQDTQWHTIVAWGAVADIVEQYVTKGKEIALEGKLRTRSYENKAGDSKTITEVLAYEVVLLGTKKQTKN